MHIYALTIYNKAWLQLKDCMLLTKWLGTKMRGVSSYL